jgi:hypothetical protein
VVGVCGSLLAGILLGLDYHRFGGIASRWRFEVNGIGVAAAVVVLGLAFGYIAWSRRPVRVFDGRESAMNANVALLRRAGARKHRGRPPYVFSTRLGSWPSAEQSTSRVAFRAKLDDLIAQGVLVRRLWHIADNDDYQKLLAALTKSSGRGNYSASCIAGDTSFLPEILCVSGAAVSVSAPRRAAPLQLGVSYHFFSRADIGLWEEYFEVLWQAATPVMIAGEIDEHAVASIRPARQLSTAPGAVPLAGSSATRLLSPQADEQ